MSPNAERFRGAPMGRPDTPPDPARPVLRVSLCRLRVNRQGYDATGAYWGVGEPLFYAEQIGGPWSSTFRASHRDHAKRLVREFFRNHDVSFSR